MLFVQDTVLPARWAEAEKDRGFRLLCISLGLFPGLMLLAPGEVSAQQAGADQDKLAMEEIVVTSRKRAEQLLDVPEQITVFTAADIESAGIDNMYDVGLLTPGVYFSGNWSPTVNTFTIRGISNNPNGDAPIAFVVDNVVYGNSFLIAQDMLDIEQIEILKGPQGALYGKGSTAGAVSIKTRKPTNELDGRVGLRIANGSEVKLNAGVSGAIVEDKALFSLAGMYRDFDGVIENEFLGREVDFHEEFSARGRLIFTPNDAWTIDLRVLYTDADHGGTRWEANNVPTGTAALGVQEGVLEEDFLSHGATEIKDYSAEITWEGDAFTFTSISNYQDIFAPRTIDLDFTRLSLLEAAIDPEDAEIVTQEIRFTSPDDQRVRWIVGGFYQDVDRFRVISASLNLTGPPFDPAAKNMVEVLNAPNELGNTVEAFFGQIDFDISDNLELSVGLRYDRDDREDILAGLQDEFSDTQPKVTLSYKPSDRFMVYGRYSEGFRSGGFNSNDVFGRRFDQEELTNLELGFKAELGNGNVRLNGAAYTMDFDNQQFFLFDSGSQALVNADKSEITGLELELHASLSDNFRIDAGVNLLDTELVELGSFPGGISASEVNGNELPFVPEYTFNLSGLYESDEFSNGMSFYARADWVQYGRIWWTIANEKADSQASYDLVNLRFGLRSDRWSVNAYVENAGDEDYHVFCFSDDFISSPFGVDSCYRGTPRRYGVELNYNF